MKKSIPIIIVSIAVFLIVAYFIFNYAVEKITEREVKRITQEEIGRITSQETDKATESEIDRLAKEITEREKEKINSAFGFYVVPNLLKGQAVQLVRQLEGQYKGRIIPFLMPAHVSGLDL